MEKQLTSFIILNPSTIYSNTSNLKTQITHPHTHTPKRPSHSEQRRRAHLNNNKRPYSMMGSVLMPFRRAVRVSGFAKHVPGCGSRMAPKASFRNRESLRGGAGGQGVTPAGLVPRKCANPGRAL